MKKTTLAVGVIAILGLSYVGIAWHTGNLIESNIDKSLMQVTEQFNNSQNVFKINISHSNDEKQLFSTKTHINMTLSSKDGSFADVLTLADKDFTIHHGPLPIAALKQGIFSPQMAWVEYETSEESNPLLWKTNGNRPFITGYISLDYSNNIIIKLFSRKIIHHRETDNHIKFESELGNGNFTFISNIDSAIPSITLNLDRFHTKKSVQYITLDKLHIDLDGEKQSNMIGYNLNLDSLKTNLKDIYFNYEYDYDKPDNNTFLIENLKANGIIDYVNQNITLNTNLDKFSLMAESDEQLPSTKLDKLSIKQKIDLSDTRVLNGSFTCSVDSILYGQQNLGNANIDIDYQGIDKALFGDGFINGDAIDNQPIHSKIELKQLNWHNLDGDINISGITTINNFDNTMLDDDNLNRINSFKLNIDAPLKVLARSYAQFHHPENNELTEQQLNESKQIVKNLYQQILNNSPLFKYNKGDEQGIFTNIDIPNNSGQANVNGDIFNKDDMLSLF